MTANMTMTQIRNRRAGVEDRWTKTVRRPDGTTETIPSAVHGKWKRWRARYVDEEGREHAKGFARKTDAQSWLDTEITAAFATGTYVDPKRGKITFASFYKEWSSRQVWVSGTKHSMDLAANSVTFSNVGLSDLRPSHLEAWVKAMQDNDLEPSTIRMRFANVRNVIRAAVRDRLMADDLRHFYASGLIRGLRCGDGSTCARTLLGRITLTTYSHLWPDANDRTRNAAAGLLDQALGAAADALRTDGRKTPTD